MLSAICYFHLCLFYVCYETKRLKSANLWIQTCILIPVGSFDNPTIHMNGNMSVCLCLINVFPGISFRIFKNLE